MSPVGLDTALLRAINGLGSPWLDWLFLGASWLGENRGVAMAMVVYFCIPKVRDSMKPFAVAVALATLAVMIVRLGVHRVRPCVSLDGLRLMTEPITASNSFPSGHAALAGALGLSAWRGRWLAWPAFAAFALLSACSRLYLGMHYPSDVIAGLCVGAASFWTAKRLLAWRAAQRERCGGTVTR
jgi:undecaprenyl-diphosphatase